MASHFKWYAVSVANFGKILRVYARLTRVEDYTTFLQFVFGFLLAKSFSATTADLILLGKTLFVLAPLLYGGIYTLNNIKDAELDKLNPKKKDRPIPAGEVSKETASWVAMVLIGAGIIFSLFLPPQVFLMALGFLALNILYTFWAKNVPYLSMLSNSATHVLRLISGMWLAGNLEYWYLAGIWIVLSVGGTVFRYIKEMSEGAIAARPVLKFYTSRSLWRIFYGAMAVLVLFVVFGRFWERIVGIFFLIWHTVGGIGYFRSKRIKKLIDFAWR